MAKELHHPERDQIDLSAVLEALSEPIRRDIVLRLLEEGEAICTTFHDRAPKSNLSYHFARLREAGITRARVEGPYRVISVRIEDLAARFPGLLDAILAASRSAITHNIAQPYGQRPMTRSAPRTSRSGG